MKVSYYPGCTLKSKSQHLEAPGIAAMAEMGVELVELERWNCCGVVSSLADDDLIHLVAPVRDLIRVKDEGYDKVVTMCSMCYNTLAQANRIMRENEEKRNTINMFMDEESDYAGEVEVKHLFDFLRDDIGWDKVKEAVKKPLTGMKIAPYYGCTLVRPKEVAIDSAENPRFIHDFITALGAEAVDFPTANECCSSYQMISHEDQGLKAVANIVGSAVKKGAEAIAVGCPLCEYNLGHQLTQAKEKHTDLKEIPSFFFTQLLAMAMGLDLEVCRLDLNGPGAAEYLKSKVS